MNSLFAFITSFLLAVIVLCIFAPHRTSAAVCSPETNYLCVPTRYTRSSCNRTSLVCDCQPSYLPTPTGCAGKPETPTVELDPGRISQRVPGAPVNLTCRTAEPGNLVFEWKKGGATLPNENRRTLTIQGTENNVLGKYRCIVTDISSGLISDASDEQELVVLNATTVKPAVKTLPQSAAPGVLLDVQCINIPYGATYKFRLDKSTDLVTQVKQDSKNKEITCVLNDISGVQWTKAESVAEPLPQDAPDITAATIYPATGLTTKPGNSVTFTCTTDPEASVMETESTKIVYSFTDTGNHSASPVGNTYTMTSTAADKTDRTVTCSAQYGTSKSVVSSNSVVSFNDNYMGTPTLIASSTLVYPGSHLFLMCHGTFQSVQVAWLKDDKNIAYETADTIQIGNFQPKDAGRYVCSVTNEYFTVQSNEIVITSNAPELRVFSSAVTVLAAVFSWRVI